MDRLLHLWEKGGGETYLIPFRDPSTNTTTWLVSLRRHVARMLSCRILYHGILGFEESGAVPNG